MTQEKKKRAEHRSWSQLSASMVCDLQATSPERASRRQPLAVGIRSSKFPKVAAQQQPWNTPAVLLPLTCSGLSGLSATTTWIYTPTIMVWRELDQPPFPLDHVQMRPQTRQAEPSSACINSHLLALPIVGSHFRRGDLFQPRSLGSG